MTTPADFASLQAVLSRHLADPDRYTIHPGDLAWWVFHADPRRAPLACHLGDDAIAVWDPDGGEVAVFGGDDRLALLDHGDRPGATVGWVGDHDDALQAALAGKGLVPQDKGMVTFARDLVPRDIPVADGYVVRTLEGEHEASSRRAASHAAFGSTMDEAAHLARYLTFMRSPVYDPARDVVAVAPDGEIAAFSIWWPDAASGIAQLEPVGTHPAHQRRGLGAAVLDRALADMRVAGMHAVRVCTDDGRSDALAFYDRVGFTRTGRLLWWAPPGR